jgi:Tol biopolymer transport system component
MRILPLSVSVAASLLAFALHASPAGSRDTTQSAPSTHARHPDPSRIAFASHRDGNWEIYLTDGDGARQLRVTTRPEQDRFPLWSPDGTKIAFGSEVGAGWELWVIDADGSNARRLATGIVAKGSRQWSPDGSRIAFEATRDGNKDIYTIRADGTGLARLTTSPAEDRDLTWSPDGSRIAFASARDGTMGIFVMRADGSEQTRITHDTTENLNAAWSPDGSAIAFVAGRMTGAREVYRVRPDGTALERLTTDARTTRDPLAWSPDGTRIAFQVVRGENYDIEMVRVSDRARAVVAASPTYDGMRAWSPDGTRLAFISSRDGYNALFVADIDGMRVSQPRRLTGESSLDPSWPRR